MAAHNRRKAAEAEEAKKRSSSDEEDEESEENEGFVEQSDTESSDEDKNKQPPPPKKQSTSLPHHSSSDDDTESESEIDLQSNSIPKSAPEVKLVSSKQTGEPSKASKKPRSKPSTDDHPSGVSSKRPADSPAPKKGNESKRAKKEKKTKEQNADEEAVEYENLKSTGGDDAKKQLFQRIWSENDEIVILKGMIEYGENQGIDPASVDMNSFFDFIIKSLHVDASKSQLSEKIRRLKKKFQTNLMKSKNGYDRTFAKPHDQTCYDLSKKIWGIESNGSYSAAKVSKKGKNVDAKAIKANLEKRIVPNDETKANGQKNIDMDVVDEAAAAIPSKAEPFYNRQPEPVESRLEKEIVKLGSQLITGAKKLELDEKLKRIQIKEIEVYLQRLDYMREQSALVLEALKANTN